MHVDEITAVDDHRTHEYMHNILELIHQQISRASMVQHMDQFLQPYPSMVQPSL